MKLSPRAAFLAVPAAVAVLVVGGIVLESRCAGARPGSKLSSHMLAAIPVHRTATVAAIPAFRASAVDAAVSRAAKPAGQEPPRDPIQGSYSADSGMTVVQRDPKHPGVILWTLAAKASRIDHADKTVTGALSGVTAQLYQKNKPAANMTAPRAVGDNVQKQITASGGVVITSINPPGRKLTADTVVWTAGTGTHTDKIVATGHVVYTDPNSGMTIHCRKLITDSRLKTVTSSNGDMDLNSLNLKPKR